MAESQPPEPGTEDLRSTADRDPTMAPYLEPLATSPGQGEPVVQTNVQNSMNISQGGAAPTRVSAGTTAPGTPAGRSVPVVIVAFLVALLLALPVLWGIIEIFQLAGVVGPWIWAWGVVLVGILAATVVIGYRIAQNGL
jgi:hypothetical protein